MSSPEPSSTSKPKNQKPLGQLLYEAGLISARQIEIALQEQTEIPNLKIGEILALRGWLKQETADFFVEQLSRLSQKPKKRPLVYYLRKAALLDEEQIAFLLEQRSQFSEDKVRFHHLAVQHGFIKQQTVDFLLKTILGSRSTTLSEDVKSFSTPYKILQRYIKGETDFQRSQLKKIKLNYVTLKGINLDNSNLAGAELKQINLSNSSLKLVDLTGANLEKAILQKVDFEYAHLSQINLTDAHLENSNFKKANLREADLRHGYLVNACFQGADLRRAKLQGANLKGATYDGETCFDEHFNPESTGMVIV